jgi:FixJ family two-component response regulator
MTEDQAVVFVVDDDGSMRRSLEALVLAIRPDVKR